MLQLCPKIYLTQLMQYIQITSHMVNDTFNFFLSEFEPRWCTALAFMATMRSCRDPSIMQVGTLYVMCKAHPDKHFLPMIKKILFFVQIQQYFCSFMSQRFCSFMSSAKHYNFIFTELSELHYFTINLLFSTVLTQQEQLSDHENAKNWMEMFVRDAIPFHVCILNTNTKR